MIDVVMPQMGESIVEGTLTRWLKKPGDRVERDEPLFEISTDKVDTEIPSPAAGTLTETLFEAGAVIGINTVVARISDGAAPAAPAPVAAAAPAPPPAPPSPIRPSSLSTLCCRPPSTPACPAPSASASEGFRWRSACAGAPPCATWLLGLADRYGRSGDVAHRRAGTSMRQHAEDRRWTGR